MMVSSSGVNVECEVRIATKYLVLNQKRMSSGDLGEDASPNDGDRLSAASRDAPSVRHARREVAEEDAAARRIALARLRAETHDHNRSRDTAPQRGARAN